MRNIIIFSIVFINDAICEIDDVTLLSGTSGECQWDVDKPTCGIGFSEINLKIINGKPTRTSDWPWLAYLRVHKRIGSRSDAKTYNSGDRRREISSH